MHRPPQGNAVRVWFIPVGFYTMNLPYSCTISEKCSAVEFWSFILARSTLLYPRTTSAKSKGDQISSSFSLFIALCLFQGPSSWNPGAGFRLFQFTCGIDVSGAHARLVPTLFCKNQLTIFRNATAWLHCVAIQKDRTKCSPHVWDIYFSVLLVLLCSGPAPMIKISEPCRCWKPARLGNLVRALTTE